LREVDPLDLLETIREGLLVLEPDLTVRFANRSFCAIFAVTPEDTVGRKLYELGNGQWDIPELRLWLYFIAGQGQATVFNTGPQAVTQNFNPGDIGYVKRAFGHYIRNTGNTDLVYLEVFNSAFYSDVSLSDWLTHTPRAMVAQTMNVDPAIIDRFPDGRPAVLPV